jgi:hypothetical protein
MERTELAWAAGFWDGEGSAWLTQPEGRGTAQPRARINQSSITGVPQVLERFRAAVGLGAVSGPEFKDGREPLYKWVVSSRSDIEQVRVLLTPWLGVVKRTQLAEVLGRARLDPAAFGSLSTDEQRAWAAGFWDGEGSVYLLKHRSHEGHFVPEASITQSSVAGTPEVLQRMSSIGPPGFRYGPFPQEPPRSPVYRWKLFRPYEIRELFSLIRPWLGQVKVSQFERVFAVLDAQPKLPRGNPAWGNRKTHCVNGHEYATARVRPYRPRKQGGVQRRDSKQCLACVREYAKKKKRQRKVKEPRPRRGPLV